jgi:hypothetical protein
MAPPISRGAAQDLRYVVDQWPRELANLYKAKQTDLKAKLNNVGKLPAFKPMTLTDI